MKPNMKQLVAVKTRNEKNFWTRVGVAYENSDGSYNLRFDYFPADLSTTTIQLRDFRPNGASGARRDEPDELDAGVAASPF